MTFFDMKVVLFVIKIANCKKRAKPNGGAHRAELMDFWKKMAGRRACRDARPCVSTVPRTGIPISYLCRIIQSPTVAPDTYQGFKHERLLFLCCPK